MPRRDLSALIERARSATADAALARRVVGLVDLTSLRGGETREEIEALCRRAREAGTAAVCIYPDQLRAARSALAGSAVRLATVANFPHGGDDIAAVVAEVEAAVTGGADEVDIVAPLDAIMDGDVGLVGELVEAARDAAGAGIVLKLILETGVLQEPQRITAAARAAVMAGIDFLKTSTGKTPVSATLEAATLLLEVIEEAGGRVGFKAAGRHPHRERCGGLSAAGRRASWPGLGHAGALPLRRLGPARRPGGPRTSGERLLSLLPQEIIRRKRDGFSLAPQEVASFIRGLTDGEVGEGQAAAFAMAVFFRGMSREETVALTLAMRDSGSVLRWDGLDGPVLDKHSTGGVGDKVSLILAPILAACGAYVPMLSGRGLGHTGGTLDKMASIPGYDVQPDTERLRRVVREAGCAIVGQTGDLAPADGRLYAIRDVTATVESVPLITASILAKKLAAGPQALVMDVKVGSGAFLTGLDEARALATSIVEVARGAGLACSALLTDMDQCLGSTAGNALEVAEAVTALKGEGCDLRLREVTLELAAEALRLGGLAATVADGLAKADRALSSGAAAERFGRMVAALGGPADFLERPAAYLPAMPEAYPVEPSRAGFIAAIDVRALGVAVIELGGGRRRTADLIDPRVGLERGQGHRRLGQAQTSPYAWSTRPMRVRLRASADGSGTPSRSPSRGPASRRSYASAWPEDRSWTCRRGRLRATGQRP